MVKYFLALFDWCRITFALAKQNRNTLFSEGEIWWCHIGMNVGVEIYGKGIGFTRPVIVFKKFGTHSFLGIPLTTQEKEGSWYLPVSLGGKRQKAILNQIRILDSRRLTKRIGVLGTIAFQKIKDGLLEFYGAQKIVTPPQEAGIGG
jgi:mRNA-degrading endonuclease toxin of MazEF toxin-antitoxin module